MTATAIAWLLHGNIAELATDSLSLMEYGVTVQGFSIPFALLMFLGGVAVTLTQRSYFRSYDDVDAGMIAMVIAVTPVAIFGLSVLLEGDSFGTLEVLSLLMTVAALVGYDFVAYQKDQGGVRSRYGNLSMFLVFSTVYVVLVDRSLAGADALLTTQSSLASLPFYWLGFGLGSLIVFTKDVREFLASLKEKRRYLKYILLMEMVGMSFYFFEVFGLEELSATLAALIIGAHVIVVWMFDIYLNRKHNQATAASEENFRVLFADLQTEEVEILENKTIALQAICIALALAGITLWPG
ncbi:MAG: hypothetical protein RL538_244 [Candidatus Parcubacteria bacterium]